MKDAGVPVAYLIATDGAAGSDDPSLTPEDVEKMRKEESLKAAAFLGCEEVYFAGLEDGGDYDVDNCNCYVVYRVKDQDDFYEKQCYVGNHVPLIYGDYTKELKLLGKALGLEVLEA